MQQRVGVLLAFAALALGAPSLARGETRTLTFTTEAIAVPAYGVSTRPTAAPSPHVDGYVVGLSAEVVDGAGRVQGRDKVMLHHVVIGKLGARDATCGGPSERFYAEGEERTQLRLPAGFGYPNRGSDRWYLLYMLMNHTPRQLDAYVRYTVRYVTGERLTPVRPYWLDVRNCAGLDPSFDVPGTGRRFSTFSVEKDFPIAESGRIVAGGGHLHGGGIRLELHNRTCGTQLFTSEPSWGGPVPRPVLHEPGPTNMSQFTSGEGIPVAAGHTLGLRAVYDNGAPHTRAMGIMLVYLAPGAVSGCGSAPSLEIERGRPSYPPVFRWTLPRPPTGPVMRDVTSSRVSEFRFQHPRVSIRRGTTFTWLFTGALQHDVTLVSGPVGFSSPWTLADRFTRRFTKLGTYSLVCSLHPAQMSQQIVVR